MIFRFVLLYELSRFTLDLANIKISHQGSCGFGAQPIKLTVNTPAFDNQACNDSQMNGVY